ncbi:MAG: hypothetical protein VKQ33_01630 [Candidatus Sericytochromatia bacterium]|nr:hypothetical protein [Candidatus Sericytochromatia bacterium]
MPPAAGALAGPPTAASPAGPLSPEDPLAAPRGALVGRVQLPASLLSNNGGRIVSGRGGGLVSDQGGSLLANHGATLLSDQGGGVVSNNGSGAVSSGGGVSTGDGAYALRQALGRGPGGDLVAIANAQVGLFDARGEAFRDASGAPLVTTTDAEGRYAFPTAPTDRALVAVCQLAGTAGQAAALVPRARGQADLDLASSVMASYVISKFARPQADPQAALERLPAGLEAQARAATAAALATGGGPARLEAAAAVATVTALRASATGVDALYEAVRRAMVIAGQSNFGEGQLALTASLYLARVTRTRAGGWWLMEPERLLEVVDGRLRVVAGNAIEATAPPQDGDPAPTTSLGWMLQSVREGPDGLPWLLHDDYLCRIEADGRLKMLWRKPSALPGDSAADEDARAVVDFFPLGGDQAVIIGKTRTWSVGGAPEYPLPTSSEGDPPKVWFADRRPTGRLRVVTTQPFYKPGALNPDHEEIALWELSPQRPPVRLSTPSEPEWHGFDDAGNLVMYTGKGELVFYSPEGAEVARFDVTGWPLTFGEGLDTANTRFGGDVRSFGWMYISGLLWSYGPGGRLTEVVRGQALGQPAQENDPGKDGPSALQLPSLVAMDAAGTTYVFDQLHHLSRHRVLLGVRDGVAERLAGPDWPDWTVAESQPGDPFAYVLLSGPPPDSTKVAQFGAGYTAPAKDAFLLDPMALSVAPNGALWVLDTSTLTISSGRPFAQYASFVRQLANGQLTTVAVKSSQDPFPWVAMVPGPADAATVLSQGSDHVKLLRVEGTKAPTELLRLPYEEACDDCGGNGMVPLPGGAWLLRVQGVLWRWEPGKAAVRVGPDRVPMPGVDSGELPALMTASAEGKVAIASERHVYRIDPATGEARRVVGEGTPNLGGGAVDTSLLAVTGLAVAPNGDLLITDDRAQQVKRVPAAAW